MYTSVYLYVDLFGFVCVVCVTLSACCCLLVAERAVSGPRFGRVLFGRNGIRAFAVAFVSVPVAFLMSVGDQFVFLKKVRSRVFDASRARLCCCDSFCGCKFARQSHQVYRVCVLSSKRRFAGWKIAPMLRLRGPPHCPRGNLRNVLAWGLIHLAGLGGSRIATPS